MAISGKRGVIQVGLFPGIASCSKIDKDDTKAPYVVLLCSISFDALVVSDKTALTFYSFKCVRKQSNLGSSDPIYITLPGEK